MSSPNPASRSSGFNIKNLIRIVSIIIPLALAGNIIYIFLASDFSALSGFGNYSLIYLGLATILVFVPWGGHTLRILLWGRAFGKNLTLGESFRTAVATDLGAAITPSTIGGSYAKFGILASFGFSPGEATLVTLLGTLEDAAFFAFTLPLAFLVTGAWNDPGIRQVANNIAAFWMVFVGFCAAMFIGYFIFMKFNQRKRLKKSNDPTSAPTGFLYRVRAKLREYRGQFTEAWRFVLRNHKTTFVSCVVLAGFGWACRYSVITLLFMGLGYPADPILFFLLQWVVFTLMTLFPTPGAVGGAEVSLALIFKGFVPGGVIPILTGAWRFLTFYLIMIIGSLILVIFGVGRTNKKNTPIAESLSEEIKVV
jgi:hypothetical protein